VLADTIFSNARRFVAWATMCWQMIVGLAICPNSFSKKLKIAQSTAANMHKKLTFMIAREMTNLPDFYSGDFRFGFIRRSRETEAKMHPISEQLKFDEERNAETPSDNSEKTESKETENNEPLESPELKTEEENLILSLLKEGPVGTDELAKKSNLPCNKLFSTLCLLELKELVVSLPGNIYQLCSLSKRTSLAPCELKSSWVFVELFTNYIGQNHHGFSRKYLQNYLAAFWCYVDRKHWTLATFAAVCSRSLPITYNDILEFVTPPYVKVFIK